MVGAAKCGTTSMWAYLKQHPDIFMSARKEPHYFAPEVRRLPLTLDQYCLLFREVKEESCIGEASVYYLFIPETANRIKQFNAKARIIIMLRNPVNMVHSLHAQLLFSSVENLLTLREAIRAEHERKKGFSVPAGCVNGIQLYYRSRADYAPQVKRYFDTFGRENVHVIIFDDFKNNTAAVYRDTLRFLGVEDSFTPDFSSRNPNTQPRSKTLMYFRHNYPEFVRTMGKLVVPSARVRYGLMQKITKLNTRTVERPPIPKDLRRQLQAEFRPSVERLSQLLERDLMHWVEE